MQKLASIRVGGNRGFTLIELLVVIAVIAILASLVLATSGYVQDRAARSRAEAEIAALSAALESYKIDNGTYPDGPAGTETANSRALIAALMPAAAGEKVYFEFPNRMLSNTTTPTSGEIMDPYGNAYLYRFPGDANQSGTNFFDLWSRGRRPTTSTEEEWIKNW